MEYVKPMLSLSGTAQALVLGSRIGDGDSAPEVTSANTKPPLVELGLDD